MSTPIKDLYGSIKVKQDFKKDWAETTKKDWKVDFATNPVVVAPVAAFTADVTTGPAGTTVHFTDSSTHTPTSWLWNFGDGNTSTLHNPQHVYAADGTYTVTLTATNAAGSNTGTRSNYISIVG